MARNSLFEFASSTSPKIGCRETLIMDENQIKEFLDHERGKQKSFVGQQIVGETNCMQEKQSPRNAPVGTSSLRPMTSRQPRGRIPVHHYV